MHKLQSFPEFCCFVAVHQYYSSANPTNKAIISLLDVEPKSDAERDCLRFLQWYICGLDKSQLIKFLRFATGLDIISVDKITMDFVKIDGMQRRPIARTCGPVLELSSTYQNFCELREEFENVLTGMSLFGWSFDFAWLEDWLTWLINYFVWWCVTWHLRCKFDEKKIFGKMSSVMIWKKVNLCWDLFNRNNDIHLESFIVFWTHKVKVLWNTLRLFVRFQSFFPEPLIGVFWFFLLVDGAELSGKKCSSFFYQKGPSDPKSCLFAQSFSLELLIEIPDLRISDFRWN